MFQFFLFFLANVGIRAEFERKDERICKEFLLPERMLLDTPLISNYDSQYSANEEKSIC